MSGHDDGHDDGQHDEQHDGPVDGRHDDRRPDSGGVELARVHYLPDPTPTAGDGGGGGVPGYGTPPETTGGRAGVPDGGELVVLSGEVVATGAQVALWRVQDAVERVGPLGSQAVQVTARVVVSAARDERTVLAVKALARNVLYVPAGALVVARRVWESRTTARYQRMMRAAEVAGNAELMAHWEEREQRFRADRHTRAMGWLAAPVAIARALALGAFSVGFVLLVLGFLLASARSDLGQVLAPFEALVRMVNAVVVAITVAWGPLVLAAPWLAVAGLWNEGRRRAAVPAWLATSADLDLDVTIDETTIATALKALRIPQITDALKVGPLAFITPARRDGRGTHAVIRLPGGVTAERIAARRADLASGLYRAAKEVWPTTGSEAGLLDLWVADKGALAEGAGPYPLLSEGVVDVFKGVPFGRTLRGDVVMAPLMERNTITGGMPGQGKSSAGRVMFAGAALDPTAELRIWVPDTNFDFEAFAPRCSRYVMGAEDEDILAIVEDLRALKAEVQARGDLLVKHQVPAVTRALASAGIGLHPLFCLLEEAHVLIQHKTYGKEAAQLLCDIVRLGRKRGIHLIVSTQAPTKDSMPRDVTRNCSNGIAFAVGDHVANDALLGAGAYRANHRATELIPGTDRGTALVKGFSGERSQIVQVYFIDIDRDHDQITPIITRSLDVIAELGTPVPGTGPGARAIQAPVRRDLLADLAAVLGTEPVPAADVPALLARAFPKWEPYKTLTGKALRALLDTDHGIQVPSTKNRFPVDPVTVREVLAARPDPDDDTEDDLDDHVEDADPAAG